MVSCSQDARSVRIDVRQQSAGWIARDYIWIDAVDKVVVVGIVGYTASHGGVGYLRMHAIQRLMIRAVGFPAHPVGHPGSSHQVTFVRCIDEFSSGVGLATEHGDEPDGSILHFDARFPV